MRYGSKCCVVGNCSNKYDRVERHYWRKDIAPPVEEHAYLDLCWFHSAYFVSRNVSTYQPGWDK